MDEERTLDADDDRPPICAACGVTVRPVREGAPSGDWGTQRLYEFDGWEVGWITAGSVEAIAAGRTVAEAVEAALIALDAQV